MTSTNDNTTPPLKKRNEPIPENLNPELIKVLERAYKDFRRSYGDPVLFALMRDCGFDSISDVRKELQRLESSVGDSDPNPDQPGSIWVGLAAIGYTTKAQIQEYVSETTAWLDAVEANARQRGMEVPA